MTYLPPAEWSLAIQFYKVHYPAGAKLRAGDEVYVLRAVGMIVAAVRLTPQSANDATFLHSLAGDRHQSLPSELAIRACDCGCGCSPHQKCRRACLQSTGFGGGAASARG